MLLYLKIGFNQKLNLTLNTFPQKVSGFLSSCKKLFQPFNPVIILANIVHFKQKIALAFESSKHRTANFLKGLLPAGFLFSWFNMN